MPALLTDVSTISATLLAVVVLVVGSLRWIRSRAWVAWTRTIGRTLRDTPGIDRRRLHLLRRDAVGPRAVERAVADEISDILGLFPAAPPFLVGPSGLRREDATRLREAYERYAAVLSRAGSHSWGAHQITVARGVGEVLQSAIDGVECGATPSIDRLAGTGFTLDLVATPGPCDVAVTYRAELHPEAGATTPRPPATPGHAYDGLLPWLTGARLETDTTNGRARLHLAFAQTTYYRFRGTNADRLARWGEEPEHLPETGLLTLSCTPVDRDGLLLLSRRDTSIEHRPGAISAFSTGNLDLRTRRRVAHDVDALGLPDPLRAIAREVREETGTVVDGTAMHAVGLSQVWSHHDRGTWVLSCTTQLDSPWRDVVPRFRHGDPVEGSWEVGQHLLVLDLPQEPQRAAAVIHGLATSSDVVAHAVADVVAIAVSRGADRTELCDAIRARSGQDDGRALRRALVEVPIERPFAPSRRG